MSKATLCGVSVVEQFGLTVGKDLDLRRIWTLANTRRHESVQILETCHLKKRAEPVSSWCLLLKTRCGTVDERS